MPDPVVCTVSPQGNVECPPGVDIKGIPSEKDTEQSLKEYLESVYGGQLGLAKLQLAKNLLEVLFASELPEANIANRRLEIVNAVNMLLEPTQQSGGQTVQPPSILLFNYSTLPAQALGPWVLSKQGLPAVQALYQRFNGSAIP